MEKIYLKTNDSGITSVNRRNIMQKKFTLKTNNVKIPQDAT